MGHERSEALALAARGLASLSGLHAQHMKDYAAGALCCQNGMLYALMSFIG